MRDIKIDCRGITDISFANGGNGSVELFQPDMSFLEDVPAKTIVNNHNNDEILEAMEYDVIVDFLEKKYDIEKIKVKR